MLIALPARPLYSACLLVVTLTVLQSAALSQQPAEATLELPVLVTDHEHRPIGELHAEQFKVTIGTAGPITPSSSHKQGLEPLALTILLDASRDTFHDMPQVADDLSSIAAASFLPTDTVSVYAVDCTMVRSLSNAPVNAAVLRKAVNDSLNAPALHGDKKASACGKTVHLWDDIAAAVASLAHQPGRRALLVISSGVDGASKYDWKTVQQYAFDQGVAVFGLRNQQQADADDFSRNALSVTRGNGAYNSSHVTPDARGANGFQLLCANAGGLTLSSTTLFRKDALADILFLIRSRYVLTIPQSAYPAETAHTVKVTLGVAPYFISPTGATKPLDAH